jgi:hypothetical protein
MGLSFLKEIDGQFVECATRPCRVFQSSCCTAKTILLYKI